MKLKRAPIKKVTAACLSGLIALSTAMTVGGGTAQAAFNGADIPAFPGAEGGGAYTSGGRGGDVYIVTNLEDYGTSSTTIEGSLRKGIMETPAGGRTIVFHVSGTIELKSPLLFKNIKNLTIAGQTAPGNGITLAGYETNISNSENIIIRYMKFRPGATNVHSGSDSMDALWGRDNNYFIIDHSSFSWNTDETLSLYRGQNGTIQWSTVYESLTLSGHSKGRHGYGGIAGGDKTTFHHNLYVNHTSRNPRFGGGYDGKADKDHVAVVQFSNNAIYNWGFNGPYGGGFNFVNYMNNINIAGPGTRDNVKDQIIDAGEKGKLGGFYVAGNSINGKTTGVLDATYTPYFKFSGDLDGDQKTVVRTTPYRSGDSTGVTKNVYNAGFDAYLDSSITEANGALLESILQKAGATYPRRDAIDARIVAEVRNGLGRYVNVEQEVGGYVSPFGVIEAVHPVNYDTNLNGIADTWEKTNGIWGVADAYKTPAPNGGGYTWLEQYINGLVDMDHAAENPEVTLAAPLNQEMFTDDQDVPVAITATSNFGNSIAKVAVYNGSEYLGDAKPAGDNYVYTIPKDKLNDGTYFISARATDSKGNATQSTAATIHVNTINAPVTNDGWASRDIGDPDLDGSASLANGVMTVKGNGKLGISEGSNETSGEYYSMAEDDFHYVYKKVTGDTEIVTKLESIGAVDNHAFTGLMIRDNLESDSAAAVLGLSWVKISKEYCWSAYLAARPTNGGNMDVLTETLDSVAAAKAAGIDLVADLPFKKAGVELGYWLKLNRTGDVFTAYGSINGSEWTKIGERTVPMNEAVYVGFAVDSNDVANKIEQLNYAKFSNIQLTGEVEYSLTIGKENTGGAGYTREISVTGSIVPENAYLAVQFTEGTGEAAKVSVVVTSLSDNKATVSYQKPGTKIEAWLVSGMPDLTGEDLNTEVYAHSSTN